MFVLYHLYTDEDTGETSFDILNTGNLGVLERKKVKLEKISSEFEKILAEYQKYETQKYEENQKKVHEFLERNIDYIREFDKNSRIEKRNDWVNLFGCPYRKDLILEKKRNIITYIVNNHYYLFIKSHTSKTDYEFLGKILQLDKLTEPLLEIQENDENPEPVPPNNYYQTNSLFIKEVEELC